MGGNGLLIAAAKLGKELLLGGKTAFWEGVGVLGGPWVLLPALLPAGMSSWQKSPSFSGPVFPSVK